VGRFMGLLGLVLSLDWCISVLLYHISHQVSGLTKIETSVLVKVSGMQPDLSSCLYQAVHVSRCFILYGGAAEVGTVPV
jgi:hypothetical protein